MIPIRKIRKALAAFVAAGGGAIGVAMLDGALEGREAIAALGVGVVALAAVFKIRNATDVVAADAGEPQHAEPRTFLVGRRSTIREYLEGSDHLDSRPIVKIMRPEDARGRRINRADDVVILDPTTATLDAWEVVEVVSNYRATS